MSASSPQRGATGAADGRGTARRAYQAEDVDQGGTRDAPLPWVPILLYHWVLPAPPRADPYGNCVSTAAFASHLAWLARRGYTCLPLAAVAGLAGRAGDLPSRPVVLTFDDGYQDTYRHAWPLLQHHDFTATIFQVSDAVGGYNDFDAGAGGARAAMLTKAELRALHRQGIGIGSHTCSHPTSLVALPDRRLREELARSKTVLEDLVGTAVEHFAYPHSRMDDRVEAAVATAGYRLACAGVGTRFTPFCLQRVAAPPGGGAMLELEILRRRLKWLLRSRQRAPWHRAAVLNPPSSLLHRDRY